MVFLPFLAMVIALLLGFPIAFSLAGAGILGIYLVTGNWNMVLGYLGDGAFHDGCRLCPDHHTHVHPHGLLFGIERSCPRPLHGRGELAIPYQGAASGSQRSSPARSSGPCPERALQRPPSCQRSPIRKCVATAIPKNWQPVPLGLGATLDILIPPSVAMVIYGIATQTSIAKLLIAGVGPGHHRGHLPGSGHFYLGSRQASRCP